MKKSKKLYVFVLLLLMSIALLDHLHTARSQNQIVVGQPQQEPINVLLAFLNFNN